MNLSNFFSGKAGAWRSAVALLVATFLSASLAYTAFAKDDDDDNNGGRRGKFITELHERTNGPSTNDEGFVFNCPVIRDGKVVGFNTSQVTDINGDPNGHPLNAVTFIHEIPEGTAQFTAPFAAPTPELGGAIQPIVVQPVQPVDHSVVNAFPQLAQFAVPVGQRATHELQFVGVNLNKERVEKTWGGIFKTTGKLRKIKNFEVRCIFLREIIYDNAGNRVGQKVIECIGCEFIYLK